MPEKLILNSSEIDETIENLGRAVYDGIDDIERFAVVGIQSSGIELADRIRACVEKASGRDVKHGILDITFYRDDLATRGVLPVIRETLIDFNINKMTILLVDDVLFTGRTTKAAIETLMSFGRPGAIKLLCLVDRGNRELPIQPDFCGKRIETSIKDQVSVFLKPGGSGEDRVELIEG